MHRLHPPQKPQLGKQTRPKFGKDLTGETWELDLPRQPDNNTDDLGGESRIGAAATNRHLALRFPPPRGSTAHQSHATKRGRCWNRGDGQALEFGAFTLASEKKQDVKPITLRLIHILTYV